MTSSIPFEKLFMGTTFASMGLVTMLFPNTTIRLSFDPAFLALKGDESDSIPTSADKTKALTTRPAPISPVLRFTMRCFGAQATLCGFLLLVAPFNKQTYAAFGAAIAPFFVFDWMAWQAGALTPFGAIGDGLGNVVFTVCCWLGYNRL
ncbi:hypothetical protein HDU96_002293 [Phlyctochytrium bullatum]|nr:hypothetical protein HDU96_002293 [Phlyctochytrium bullatum]